MAFQPVPNTARFDLVVAWGGGSDEYMNTFYVNDDVSSWTPTRLADCAEVIGDAWVANWIPNTVDDAVFARVDYRDLEDEFGFSGSVAYNVTPSGGVNDNEPVPPSCPLLVTLHGDPGAAPRSGRLFLIGGDESNFAGATMLYSEGLVASAVAAVEAVIDDVNGFAPGTSAVVIVSRFHNNAARANGVTNTISSVSGRRLAGSQRDRRPGVGS